MSCEIQPARHNHQLTHQQGTEKACMAWPKGPNWPKMPILGQFWSFLGKKSFFLLDKSKLLLSPVKTRIFCPKTTKFCPKLVFLVILGQALPAYLVPCWWVGWCLWPAGCISQDTYLLYDNRLWRELLVFLVILQYKKKFSPKMMKGIYLDPTKLRLVSIWWFNYATCLSTNEG